LKREQFAIFAASKCHAYVFARRSTVSTRKIALDILRYSCKVSGVCNGLSCIGNQCYLHWLSLQTSSVHRRFRQRINGNSARKRRYRCDLMERQRSELSRVILWGILLEDSTVLPSLPSSPLPSPLSPSLKWRTDNYRWTDIRRFDIELVLLVVDSWNGHAVKNMYSSKGRRRHPMPPFNAAENADCPFKRLIVDCLFDLL